MRSTRAPKPERRDLLNGPMTEDLWKFSMMHRTDSPVLEFSWPPRLDEPVPDLEREESRRSFRRVPQAAPPRRVDDQPIAGRDRLQPLALHDLPGCKSDLARRT